MTTQQLLLTIGLMVAGYLLGSVPFSFIVARANGVDLRKVGSGNVGGSNVWRNVGFGAFLLAAGGDLLKGTVVTLAAMYLANLPPVAVVLVGLAAIAGHTFSVFLNFRGGKAVATSGGVLLAIYPLLVGIGVVIWAIVFVLGRMASLASLSAALAVGIAATVFYLNGALALAYMIFAWVAVVVIFYLHRENIKRLMAGTENKFQKLF